MYLLMNTTDDAGVSGPKTYHVNGSPRITWPPSNDFWTDYWSRKRDGYRIELFLVDDTGAEKPITVEEIRRTVRAAN